MCNALGAEAEAKMRNQQSDSAWRPEKEGGEGRGRTAGGGSHHHPRAARLVPVREGRLRYFFSGVNYKTRE